MSPIDQRWMDDLEEAANKVLAENKAQFEERERARAAAEKKAKAKDELIKWLAETVNVLLAASEGLAPMHRLEAICVTNDILKKAFPEMHEEEKPETES